MSRPDEKPLPMYEFAIRFRNDRMGFTKSYAVQAQHAQTAIAVGQTKLVEKGYDPVAFQAIEVIRGREVGT